MTVTLTSRERATVDFICRHVDDVGYPPSIREIGEAIGLSSTASVSYVLDQLVSKGAIRRDPSRPRALVVIAS